MKFKQFSMMMTAYKMSVSDTTYLYQLHKSGINCLIFKIGMKVEPEKM